MNLLTTNGVKIFNVTAGKSLPEWLSEKKREELRKNQEFRQRIELIQDFSFETSSRRVKITPDGQYLMATGIYPPQMKIFELSQLSSKVTRTMDAHVVQFEVLSDDYSKPVFLRDDRYIEFHAKFGTYFQTRIPKLGRDISYHKPSCDLYVGAAGNEVYRLNLEDGRFVAPLVTDLPAVNVVAQNPVHQLMMFGGENGVIECWDPRQRNKVAAINAAAAVPNAEYDVEISAGKFGPDGLSLGLGTSTGGVVLYDIRSPTPLMVKHHQYQLPINSINFHTYGGHTRLISADSKILKVFEKDTGKIFMVLEPKSPINDVTIIDGTGLLLMPGETQKIQSYYVPSLGPAPKWCSFLDNLTEELEEDKQLVYEDYKFITRDEVEKLNISHLIGTGFLKAYMHGFFIHIKLYNKFKALVDNEGYEAHRQKKVQEELNNQIQSRISVKKVTIAKPKVNANLANRLQAIPFTHRGDENDKKIAEKEAPVNTLADGRFGELWKNPDFEIDEESTEFLRHNPRSKLQKLNAAIAEHFESVEDDDDDEDEVDDRFSSSKLKQSTKLQQTEDDEEDVDEDMEDGEDDENTGEDDQDFDDGEEMYINTKNNNNSNNKKKVNMFEIKQGHSLSSISNKNNNNSQLLRNAPFAIRVDRTENEGIPDSLKNAHVVTKDSGDLEISFVPSKKVNNKRFSNKRR